MSGLRTWIPSSATLALSWAPHPFEPRRAPSCGLALPSVPTTACDQTLDPLLPSRASAWIHPRSVKRKTTRGMLRCHQVHMVVVLADGFLAWLQVGVERPVPAAVVQGTRLCGKATKRRGVANSCHYDGANWVSMFVAYRRRRWVNLGTVIWKTSAINPRGSKAQRGRLISKLATTCFWQNSQRRCTTGLALGGGCRRHEGFAVSMAHAWRSASHNCTQTCLDSRLSSGSRVIVSRTTVLAAMPAIHYGPSISILVAGSHRSVTRICWSVLNFGPITHQKNSESSAEDKILVPSRLTDSSSGQTSTDTHTAQLPEKAD